MTLNDVISQLRYGELRSLAVKDDNIAIASYVNLALIALYGRFTLKMGEQLIPMENNIVDYTLNSDLLIIDSIYDENGNEFHLDDETSLFSILQSSYNTIQVPNPVTGSTLSIIYNQAPDTIIYDDTDAGTIAASLALTIPIPPQLLEALLHYIGYRAHGSVNGDIKAENNTHYMRYEAACKRIDDLGLIRRVVPPAYVNQQESITETDTLYQDPDL